MLIELLPDSVQYYSRNENLKERMSEVGFSPLTMLAEEFWELWVVVFSF